MAMISTRSATNKYYFIIDEYVICFVFLINLLNLKMSENSEKSPPLSPRAQCDVFQSLVLSD